METFWLACDLVTGQVAEELRDVRSDSLQRIVGAYSSASVTLPVGQQGGRSSLPTNWEGVTTPRRSLLVAVDEDLRILWGGFVNRRSRVRGGVTLDLVTCEGYLDRRYVGDHTWTNKDQTSVIAAGLIGDANTNGIGLEVDAPASGVLRDRSYQSIDDATVYSRLTELMGVDNGPEFTIDLAWNADQTAVVKTIRVRDRIGTASASPDGVFEHDATHKGGLLDWSYDEDYSSDSGATDVTATSSGAGDQRLSASATSGGDPVYEYRFSPSDSITVQATLQDHANRVRDLMAEGKSNVSLQARLDVPPLLGVQWNLGDDIAWKLKDEHIDLGGVARCLGVEVNLIEQTVKPILEV